MAQGTVKFWKSEKGWGAISSPELPPGQDAFAHFAALEMEGYRELEAGQAVDFDYERGQQDSFNFRATRVRPVDR